MHRQGLYDICLLGFSGSNISFIHMDFIGVKGREILSITLC